MVATIAIILVVLWFAGMLTGNVFDGMLHLLIVGALVMMAVTTVSRRKGYQTPDGES